MDELRQNRELAAVQREPPSRMCSLSLRSMMLNAWRISIRTDPPEDELHATFVQLRRRSLWRY
jgi:hypothetical protein